jgi:hypothetical protein
MLIFWQIYADILGDICRYFGRYIPIFWAIHAAIMAVICQYFGRYPCIFADADSDADMADTDILFSCTNISVSDNYIG